VTEEREKKKKKKKKQRREEREKTELKLRPQYLGIKQQIPM